MKAPFQTAERLYFGDLDCCGTHEDWAVVHACKDPCHRKAVAYAGKIETTHPHYLSLEKPHHLYLNLIDPPFPLFKLESFSLFFDFVDREIAARPVLIHCNQGQSRAPSLVLLYMAKRLGLLPDESYKAARDVFEKKFLYTPGKGMETFLHENWASLGFKK